MYTNYILAPSSGYSLLSTFLNSFSGDSEIPLVEVQGLRAICNVTLLFHNWIRPMLLKVFDNIFDTYHCSH